MKIHEYQAKELLRPYGFDIPPGEVATTPDQAAEIAGRLGGQVVIKAQVHAGGRGKAGGVKLAANAAEAKEKASHILGMLIKGLTVEKVLVTETADIAQEIYLGGTMDRDARLPVIMASMSGGIDIEEVAVATPEKIVKQHVHPTTGLTASHVRRILFDGGFPAAQHKDLGVVIRALYKAYEDLDCTLVEINPLIINKAGKVQALDAKMDIDDNAMFRHKNLEDLFEASADDELERIAQQEGITYVHLDGDVGIIGNGAGLVMTSLDVVSRVGGKPNNFLDIGGGAKADHVKKSLGHVLKDPKVKGVLFNIFGGITRCDEVAKGLLEGIKSLGVTVPVVVRLSGTNEEEGRKILQENATAGVYTEATMLDAAKRIVALIGGAK